MKQKKKQISTDEIRGHLKPSSYSRQYLVNFPGLFSEIWENAANIRQTLKEYSLHSGKFTRTTLGNKLLSLSVGIFYNKTICVREHHIAIFRYTFRVYLQNKKKTGGEFVCSI